MAVEPELASILAHHGVDRVRVHAPACFDEPLRAKIDQIKSDLHHAPGTRLLLERAVLLVVIDSSENLENPEQPDSWLPELNKHRLR